MLDIDQAAERCVGACLERFLTSCVFQASYLVYIRHTHTGQFTQQHLAWGLSNARLAAAWAGRAEVAFGPQRISV